MRGTGDSQGSWGLFDPIQTRDGDPAGALGGAAAALRAARSAPTARPTSASTRCCWPAHRQALAAQGDLPDGRRHRHLPRHVVHGRHARLRVRRRLPGAHRRAATLLNPLIDAVQNPPTDASASRIWPRSRPITPTARRATTPGRPRRHPRRRRAGLRRRVLAGPRARALLDRIVANGIPAYLVGGEFDIFQRGEPLNYAGLQNAWAGRPTTAPMRAGQQTTGRYQLIDGPWEHLNGSSVDVDRARARVVRHVAQGRADRHGAGRRRRCTTTTSDRQLVRRRRPIRSPGARPTRLYFGAGSHWHRADGRDCRQRHRGVDRHRQSVRPAGRPVVDGRASPCRPRRSGWRRAVRGQRRHRRTPADLAAYTTAPFRRPPGWPARSRPPSTRRATTADTQWVAEVEDVAPDGTSLPAHRGRAARLVPRGRRRAAAGSRAGRDVPAARTTRTRRQSSTPVVPGQMTRYDIEIFPTFATIAEGHSLRVTLVDLRRPAPDADARRSSATLAGGVYTVHRGGAHASAVEVPLQRP